jgi:lipopolysaccharide transport system ATP-binding protein
MGKSIAIKVENLSKAYQLGQIGTGTISRDLERFWTTKIRGKEDPFLKIGQTNDRTVKGDTDIVWSLKDINFEIEQGDAVGIIGRNGAGKSTLLKLLSRVTGPTTGNIKVMGRIASLLEVGTGFHPELTGRENIYLNGAILGMRKKEITRKFDEIVDFSGVERYIDTPVKRYSSGMYVRLAFAVAANLESEIMIVDEVLAVGDAEFQKKCLGKMGDVSKGEGRTVLFVSHNLIAVDNLCDKGLLMDNGRIVESGKIHDLVSTYMGINNQNSNQINWNTGYFSNDFIDIEFVGIMPLNAVVFTTDTEIKIEIKSKIKKCIPDVNLLFDICLYNSEGVLIFDVVSIPQCLELGSYNIFCFVPKHLLNCGIYTINLLVVKNHGHVLFKLSEILKFEILEGEREIEYYNKWPGIIRPRFNWKIVQQNVINI